MPLTIAIVGEEPCLRSSQVKDLLHYYLLEYYDGVVSLNSALKETVPDVIVSDETIFDKTIEVLDRMTTGDYSRKPVCVCICRRQKQGRPIASSDNSLFHPLGNGSPPLRQTIDQALIRKITEDMTTDREEGSFRIVGSSQSLRRQIALTQKSAVYDEPVLITGDTGTGKELFARYLHLYSRRHSQPYHVVNCSAISNDLFESELFGHKKGAFTGALADSDGLFRLAHHGTLVLDEISEIEPRFQVKLLRAIENQEILSVGGQIAEKINTRVVALSNRDLWREMERGTFRPDLFHRLNKFHIHLPTLKEREDDYEELFFHFLEQTWFSRLEKWKELVDKSIFGVLRQVEFCGNVRDVHNLVMKVLVEKTPSEPEITRSDVLQILRTEQTPLDNEFGNRAGLTEILRQKETEVITHALTATEYNISLAAKKLRIARQTLQYRIRKLGIDLPSSFAEATL